MTPDLIALGVVLTILVGSVALMIRIGASRQRGADADKTIKAREQADTIERDIDRMPDSAISDELRDDWTKP